MRAVRVNETKVISRNAFIDNLFPLKSEKETKNDETTLFRDCPRKLDLPVNFWTPNVTSMLFSGLL